jgi:hypothetical protein
MSLGIIIKAPEGIVLAAESRVTLSVPGNGHEIIHVNFDNATKVLSFNKPYNKFGVVTYGQAAIGVRTAQTFIPEFEVTLPDDDINRLSVLDFSTRLSDFFMNQWQNSGMPIGAAYLGQDMTFNVAGFDDNEPYGKVYTINIPRNPHPVEQSPVVDGQVQFGIVWGGQREIVDRLIMGYDARILDGLIAGGIIQREQVPAIQEMLRGVQLQIPIQFMPIQDCVNLALLFIRTTITTQSLTVGLRGTGGAIDVAIITKEHPLTFIQKKEIKAEQN